MTINLQKPDITELKPRITVYGVGGGGGNAVNNMIAGGLEGVDFVVANTDAQALTMSKAERIVQMGVEVTEGLGAGSQPEVGRAAAEECLTEITDHLAGTHMAFVTAGMGGGTGTGAAPVVARAAREMGILTVGVVTKPFHFEGQRRMHIADAGINELQKNVDTLIVIPNQNLFRIANDKTTFADAFGMADQVLYSGVACITDLMVKEGLINLDFADVRSVMNEMGKAMMGTGESSGDGRAIQAAEAAISNPLLDESSMLGAQGLLISITGGRDMTLFEVDEAATRIREEVDANANIILGATFDEKLEGTIRVSVVATGIDSAIQVNDNELGELQSETNSAINAGQPAYPVGARIATRRSSTDGPALDNAMEKIERATSNLSDNAAASGVDAGENGSVEKNGVRIEPFQPQNSVFSNTAEEEEFRNALEAELMPRESEVVPPVAQIADHALVMPEIPNVRDFPPIAKAEIAAETKPTASDDRGPMGLLKKLKSGFGIQDEVAEVEPASGADQSADQQATIEQATIEQATNEQASIDQPTSGQIANDQTNAPVNLSPAPIPLAQARAVVANNALSETPTLRQSAVERENPSQSSPYAPKRNNLDQNGRINATQKPSNEEDQLDIPAFLRRQSN